MRAGRGEIDGTTARLVLGGLILGVLAGTAWAALPAADSPAAVLAATIQRSEDGWTERGWTVDPDRPWEGAVVRITNQRCNDEIRGTGVVVDGAVLTNRHVVEGARSLTLTTADGEVHQVTAIAASNDVDLARVEAGGLPEGLEMSPPASPSSSDSLHLVGFPGGHEMSSRPVAVAGTQRGWRFPDPSTVVRLDTAVVGGESGSAVVDGTGHLAGLLYARATDDGAGLVMGAADLRDDLGWLDRYPFAPC